MLLSHRIVSFVTDLGDGIDCSSSLGGQALSGDSSFEVSFSQVFLSPTSLILLLMILKPLPLDRLLY